MNTEQQKILAGKLNDALDPECPGVTLGSRTVIGAGSVVTKDIPNGVFAAGNPHRVIRQITEEHHD